MANRANTSSTLEIEEEVAALVESGYYESERELLRDALEALLDANPSLRLELAMTLWTQKKITLSRAVEIAHSDHETFKQELAKRGHYIEVEMSAEEIRNEAKRISTPRN